MLYQYDEKSLKFYSLSTFKILVMLFSIASFISLTSIIIGKQIGKSESIVKYSEMEKMIIIKEADPFSKESLVEMFSGLNVKYPHIVLAQSIVETGHWKSTIFLENHNLFGMKEARRRITTAGGTNRNHAYYRHWRESVYDYAFYQCRYLSKISSEEEYFQYLSASYAEAPDYVNVLKATIEKESLKVLFN